MRLFDLSLRHKLPLWGAASILVAALSIALALMARAYDDLRHDLAASSMSLAETLANTLFPALLHDDLWRAYEIVRAPFTATAEANPFTPESIFVLDRDLNVLVASDPDRLPTLMSLSALSGDYARLVANLPGEPLTGPRLLDPSGSRLLFVLTPIASGGRHLGILAIAHPRNHLWARFIELALRGGLIACVVLTVLLPINWYWGRRMAEPLIDLAQGMSSLVKGEPKPLAAERYPYHDELGQLFAAYRETAAALHEKALLEKEMLHAERLAAVGRLAAGIAHEVNNPLGGMLMALDTLRQRGITDAPTAKTLALIERGLQQIAETIGALLVEARQGQRSFSPHDLDDVRTLIEPQATKKALSLVWSNELADAIALPSGAVRQILINLLLNAVQATAPQGRVRCETRLILEALEIVVANTGDPLPENVRAHLFEPFVAGRDGGHGLGLWVTYEVVRQLGGQIEAHWQDGEMRFSVRLPLVEEGS